MQAVATVPGARPQLVKKEFARRQVQSDLAQRGFKAALYGTNIYILNRLSVPQYRQFLGLLDELQAYITGKFDLPADQLIPLTLPWPGALGKIKFDRLRACPGAMGAIKASYVFPQGKTLVKLSALPQIYNDFVMAETSAG